MNTYKVGLFMMLLCIVTSSKSQEMWRVAADLAVDITYPGVIQLDNTEVLLCGGFNGVVFAPASNACQIVRLQNGEISVATTQSMPTNRAEFPVVVFGDSLAYAIGGFSDGGATSAVDVFNYRTRRWSRAGSLKYGRRQHAACQLSDTEVLVVGGRLADLTVTPSCEIFNVVTGTSKTIADYPLPTASLEAIRTPAGMNMFVGGRAGGANSPRLRGVYTYDVGADLWKSVWMMSIGRQAPLVYQSIDGSSVIVGGSVVEDPFSSLGEVIVERNGQFRSIASIDYGLTHGSLAEFRPGQLIVIGGWKEDLNSTESCRYVDLASGRVTKAPDLNAARRYTKSVTFVEGNRRYVCVIGGVDNNGAIFNIEMLTTPCDYEEYPVLGGQLFLTTVGDARRTGNSVVLTADSSNSVGAVWMASKMKINAEFTVDFSFRMNRGRESGSGDGGSPGGDGLALVMQTASASPIGASSRGIGYDNLPSGVAVEFDSHRDGPYLDPSTSHVAIQAGDGTILSSSHAPPYLIGSSSDVPELKADGTIYYARVAYTRGELAVWLDTTPILGGPVLSVPIDLASAMSASINETFWLGFTAATGASVQEHVIESWSISSCEPIIVGVNNDDQRERFGVFPNPSSDRLIVQLTEEFATPCHVIVRDLNGSVVFKDVYSNSTIYLPIRDLAVGSYSLTVVNQHRSETTRIVISR